ncbi:unnamed protein product [Polarella glacialis]|uniref:UBX domain-containing protein n=2 Tax=Polarella glacialis TaxID=89957 RepID=A0A813KDB5_POLGL|nr:unnamed protein product [Polarella glacialis]
MAAAKSAISGSNSKFESADKKRLAELLTKKVHQMAILRVTCPDKSVLQVHFRSADTGEHVLEQIKPLLAEHVRERSWYIYQSPPLQKIQPKVTLVKAGFAPGANLYLGFDGEKPAPPFFEPGLVRQLGAPPQVLGGVVAPTFSGEAMGWGSGQSLGGGSSSAAKATPAWLKPKNGASASSSSGGYAEAASGGASAAPIDTEGSSSSPAS